MASHTCKQQGSDFGGRSVAVEHSARATAIGDRRLDAEQPPRTWLEQESERRREEHRRERSALELDRRSRRRQRTLAERLADVMREISRLPTSPAASIEHISGGGEHDAPPAAETLDVSGDLRVIEARVANMEYELDVHRGLSPARDGSKMLGLEKDRILREECEGMHFEDVADAYPYLGSPRTIRRARARLGLRGVDGRPKDPPDSPRPS